VYLWLTEIEQTQQLADVGEFFEPPRGRKWANTNPSGPISYLKSRIMIARARNHPSSATTGR
jgi:hypothetical protein